MGKIEAPNSTPPKGILRAAWISHQHVLEPPFLFVTDPFLLKHITAFAHGIPWPLYEFWLEHKPAGEPVLAGFRASHPVVEKLAQHGTLPFLDLADQVRFPSTREKELLSLDLSSVVRFAVQYIRPELLQWGITHALDKIAARQLRTGRHTQSFTRTSVLVDAWELAIRDFRDGDSTIMLEVLSCSHRRSDEPALRYLFSSSGVEKKVASCAELLHWFIKEAPDLHIERRLLRHARRPRIGPVPPPARSKRSLRCQNIFPVVRD